RQPVASAIFCSRSARSLDLMSAVTRFRLVFQLNVSAAEEGKGQKDKPSTHHMNIRKLPWKGRPIIRDHKCLDSSLGPTSQKNQESKGDVIKFILKTPIERIQPGFS